MNSPVNEIRQSGCESFCCEQPKMSTIIPLVAAALILASGLAIAIGSIVPALGEGRALAQALSAIVQQPDEANTITRTLFVGTAMVKPVVNSRWAVARRRCVLPELGR